MGEGVKPCHDARSPPLHVVTWWSERAGMGRGGGGRMGTGERRIDGNEYLEREKRSPIEAGLLR